MMDAKNIRAAMQAMAAGKLDKTQQEQLLLQLTEAEAQATLDPVFPIEEWESTAPLPVDRQELEQLYTRITGAGKKTVPRIFRMEFWKAACILLLVMAGAGAAWYFSSSLKEQPLAAGNSWKTISTEDGKMQKLILEDGTVVYVNGGTLLELPYHFSSTERRIRLHKGEVFIEAAPDPKRPMLANMNGMEIRVLGTSFNLRDYSDEPDASIALHTGKLAVSSGFTSSPILLDPGQTASFQKLTGKLDRSIHQDDPGAWVRYDFHFNQLPLQQVLRKLQHAYGVKFEVKDSLLLKRPVKASFRGQQLKDVLRILGKMGAFNYSVNHPIIHIHPQQLH